MHRYGNWWLPVGLLGLVGGGVATGFGNLGVALLLLLLAPIALTVGALQTMRASGSGSLSVLGVFPLTERQRRFFSGWFLFAGFMAFALVVDAICVGLAALL